MIALNLYPEIEWYFFHYKELKLAPPSLLYEIDGKKVACPAAWVGVLDKTYKMHENLISRAMKMRYHEHKTVEVITGLLNIKPRMFYRWREEFLSDAVMLAMQNSLVRLKCDTDKPEIVV